MTDTFPAEQPAANWYAACVPGHGGQPCDVSGLWPDPELITTYCANDCLAIPVRVRAFATDPIPDPTSLPKYLNFPRVAWAVASNDDGLILGIFPTMDEAHDFCEPDVWSLWPVVVSVEQATGDHPKGERPEDNLTYPIPSFVRRQQEVNDAS